MTAATDLAVREDHRAKNWLTNEQLQFIANTEFVVRDLRGNLPAILACVATGRALGIDDMTALRCIHIIDGRPTFSAELMVMVVRREGHSLTGNFSAGSCTVTGRRADNGDEMSVTWTTEMAAAAGLVKKQNWVRYEASMLWARAVSQLCRMLFADCFAGGTYTAEELGDDDAPAEEMSRDTIQNPEGVPVDDGKFPPPDVEMPPLPVISDAQRTRLFAIAGKRGVTEEALRALVAEVAGVESTKLIPAVRYDALVSAVESAVVAEGGSAFVIPESARQGG